MLISQWRSGLRAWLNQYLVIATWELRNPTEYNSTNGFLPPLQSIVSNSDALGTCSANQDIYLTTRFRGDVKYDQLPLGQLEQLYAMVGRGLIAGYAGIAPLADFDLLPVVDSIQIVEYGDDLGDWLVTLVFSMQILWVPTITLLPGATVSPLILPNRIDIGLFTEKLYSTNHLDPVTRSKVGDLTVTL